MRAFAAALLFSFCAVACSKDDSTPTTPASDAGADATDVPPDSGCADCGECGIAGPILQDAIQLVKVGKDTQGRPAALVNGVKHGECRGALNRPEVVHVVSATAIDSTDGEEMIDTSVVDASGNTYTWKDRTLTLVETNDPPDLTLSFTGDSTFTVVCTANGDFVVCKKQ